MVSVLLPQVSGPLIMLSVQLVEVESAGASSGSQSSLGNLPVGGVLLDKAATLIGQNLTDITGAMYDR